ncbi:MAG: hypothetical protein Q4C13_00920, partial [Clostridia bacterium]|nr:hypothetical protein [Clostridia bacterium]
MMSTHFRGEAERAGAHYRARGRMPGESAAQADYSFQLVSGSLEPPREALRVCTLLGLPGGLVERAKELIDKHNREVVK